MGDGGNYSRESPFVLIIVIALVIVLVIEARNSFP